MGLGLGWGAESVNVRDGTSYAVDVTSDVSGLGGVGDLSAFLIAHLTLLMLRRI